MSNKSYKLYSRMDFQNTFRMMYNSSCKESEVIMSEQSQHILEEVMELSPAERAELAEKILESFELPARKEIDELWAIESEERIDAYKRGNIEAIPAEEVFKDIKGQSQ